MQLMQKKFIPIGIIVLALLIFLGLVLLRPKPPSIARQERTWNVNVIRAQLGDYSPNIILYGRVESPRESKLKAAIEADVIKTPVLEGEHVKKGELIIALDDRDATLFVKQRQAEVNELISQEKSEMIRYKNDQAALAHEKELLVLQKRSVDRQAHLVKTRVGSPEAFDQSRQELQARHLSYLSREFSVMDHQSRLDQIKANLSRAQSLLEQAKLDLERSQVKAPFGGKLTALHVSVGDRVQIGEMLAELFDIHALEIRAQIPSKYLPRARAALAKTPKPEASATIDGKPVQLKLMRLAARVAAGRGGIDGYFVVVKNGGDLAIGRSVEMIVQLSPEKDVYAFPSTALYGKDRIYKVVKGRLVHVKVQRVGTFTEENGQYKILVKSPEIQTGDQIVTTQLANARDGLKIRVIP